MQKHIITGLVLIVVGLITFGACNKSSLVGVDILPPDDYLNIQYTDTLTLRSKTIQDQDVKVHGPDFQLDGHFLGALTDPVFGKTEAQLYSQFRLLSQPSFIQITDSVITSSNGDAILMTHNEVDSVILVVSYVADGHYGILETPQAVQVYELAEPLETDVEYRSNQTFTKGALLGQHQFIANPENVLNISLDKSIGEKIINYIPSNDAVLNNLDTLNADFASHFYGINIVPAPNNTALMKADLSTASTKIVVHYKTSTFVDNELKGTKDNSFEFVVNSKAVKVSNITHNFAGTPVEAEMDNDSLLFIQSMAGTSAQIDIPYAQELQGIIVNKAELIVTVIDQPDLINPTTGGGPGFEYEDGYANAIFSVPELIVCTQFSEDEGFVFVDDVIVSLASTVTFSIFGGTPQVEIIGGTQVTRYSFNVTAHFQNMIEGKTSDNSIYLSTYPKKEGDDLRPTSNAQIAHRVVLGGSNNDDYKMDFRVTYTKLD